MEGFHYYKDKGNDGDMINKIEELLEEYKQSRCNDTIKKIIKLTDSLTEEELIPLSECLLLLLYLLVDEDNDTAIDLFVSSKCADVVYSFLDDPQKAKDFDLKYHCQGLSPMGMAVKLGHASAIRSLMNHYYFDLSALYLDNRKESSALDIALENDHDSPDFLVFLIENDQTITFESVYKLYRMGKKEFVHSLIITQVETQFKENFIKTIQKNAIDCCHNPLYDSATLTEIIDDISNLYHFYPISCPSDQDLDCHIQKRVLFSCNETIRSAEVCQFFLFELDEIYGVRLVTNLHTYLLQIDYERHCCEWYGGYIVCEDDLDDFIGADLLEIYLTDTCLNTHIVDRINLIQNCHNSCDYHNIQFINLRTSKGLLQFVVYNCHNGYYGHDVTVKIDDKTLYNTII